MGVSDNFSVIFFLLVIQDIKCDCEQSQEGKKEISWKHERLRLRKSGKKSDLFTEKKTQMNKLVIKQKLPLEGINDMNG